LRWLTTSAVYEITPQNALIPVVKAQTIEKPKPTIEKPKDLFYGEPVLKKACSCESWGVPNKEPRQFKNGKVLRGEVNQNDVGACQINETVWLKTAKKKGLDIEGSLPDNIAMAKYIKSVQGMGAWTWSFSCWSK